MTQLNLSRELQNLINPEPTFEDPEDDVNIDTSDKWIHSATANNNDDDTEAPAISKIRKKQVSILSSLNKRYIGKKVSRNDLESDDADEEVVKEERRLNDNMDSNIESSDRSDDEEEEEEDESESDIDEEEDKMNGSADDDLDDLKRATKATATNGDSNADGDDDINILNFDAEKQMSKASAVKNQLIIYDNLLEARIRMQKLLLSSNRLPQGPNLDVVKSAKSTLLRELMDECYRGVRKLGKYLLEMDAFVDLCDEEEPNDYGKKRKCASFDETSLSKRFCQLSSQYRPIIERWHERTKFVHANVKLKKFESFDICPTKSIDQILTNKERLIGRTHVKRSAFKIIGQIESGEDEQKSNFNEEIYDDDDFYHQILRQIIENKIGDTDDSTAMSKKYMEIQRMRNKLKKQVDTRASKGRKIRYEVHEKLVNFMAPVDRTSITDEAKNELFKSLFGNFTFNIDD